MLRLSTQQSGILRSINPGKDPYYTAHALRHLHAGRQGPYTPRELAIVRSRAKKAGYTVEYLIGWLELPPLTNGT